MKHLFTLISFLLLFSCTYQPKQSSANSLLFVIDSIKNEGYEMFYLEKCSWLSTDIIKKEFGNISKIKNYNGYFTYRDGYEIKSVYLKLDEKDTTVFATFKFSGKDPNLNNLTIDRVPRALNSTEKYLYKCREQVSGLYSFMINAIDSMNTASKSPKKISFNHNHNFVYMLDYNRLRVFALQATIEHDFLPMGNDYVFTFDRNNKKLTQASVVHSFIETEDTTIFHYDLIKQVRDSKGKYKLISEHNHYGSNYFMTSTDICNFLLYSKSESMIVMSPKFVSIFTPYEKNKFLIFRNEDIKNFKK